MYDIRKYGEITAIRIYYKDNSMCPMADLAFAFGGVHTIEWTNKVKREEYKEGMNGYTLIYDERSKFGFDSFMKKLK